jgi:hypothetical protein
MGLDPSTPRTSEHTPIMNHTSTPEKRKARKPHRCDWCSERIEKGTTYENTFQVCEGDAWRSKMHLECGEASRKYDYDGDTISLDGQFQRGHIHEPNYYAEEDLADGVADGCPGCIKQAEVKKGSKP